MISRSTQIRTLAAAKKQVSRSTRRDPVQAKTLRVTYEKGLVRLFRTYRTAAVEVLTLARENEARALEPTPIRIAWLVEELELLAKEAILGPGEVVVSNSVKTGYRRGVLYAERALARIGITSKLGEGPADWRVLDVLRVRNLQALKGVTAEMNKQIVSALTEGINKGESVVKLARRLRDQVDGIGIQRARLMAHTETMYACNEGALLRYRQHGIKTIEWLCAGNPCTKCQENCGKPFPINEAPPCPLHPRCRCTLLPVIDDDPGGS
ncbi:minor capsid protein [Methanoculleus sp. UBA208]|uniref:minor capsid protein n=1 Tax=Methanoculleus sp. UBA208 TaxID=1915494 RepID=UPI0025CECBF0|nr:minor capsid protein [Methanoculleus sp. UBA208]